MNIVLDNKWIGQRTIRPDGMDKVTGRAQFAGEADEQASEGIIRHRR